jgi:hypothetical protein
MKINEYNIEAYRYIRTEIDNRVQMHYKMVMWKIALGGGLIAFLIDKGQSIPISPFILSAIFLFLMDVVIIENLGHIRGAGRFVRNNIENFTNKNSIITWERDFAQVNGNWCFSVQGYVFGIWIIAPLLLIVGFAVDFDPTKKMDIAVLIVSLYMGGYSLFLVTRELGSKKVIPIEQSESPLKK